MNKTNFLKKIFKPQGKKSALIDLLHFASGSGDRRVIEYYQSIVFACISIIAKSFAKIEWQLYQLKKNKEVVEIEEHPLLELISKFNSRFTKFDSLEMTAIYYLLYGKAPWLVKGKGKYPEEIEVLLPTKLSIVKKDENNNPVIWRYQNEARGEIIPAENIIYIRNPHPADPSEGLSVLEAVKITADTDYYAQRWNRNLMKNDASPSLAVETSQVLDEEQYQLTLKKLEERLGGGFENAGKITLLMGGTTIKNLGIPPKDLEFMAGRRLNWDEIMAIFNVPKILLGLESGYNRATAEAAERTFLRYTIEPLVEKIIQQLNEFLVPKFGEDLWLSFKPLVMQDRQELIEELDKGYNKWLTPNEVRQELGYEEIKGGDYIYLPLTMMAQMGGTKKEAVIKLEKKYKSGLNLKIQDEIRKKILARKNKTEKIAKEISEKIEKKISEKHKVVLTLNGKTELKENLIKIDEDKKLDWWKMTAEIGEKAKKSFEDKLIKLFARQRDVILENLKKRNKKDLATDVMFDKNEEIKATIEIIKPELFSLVMAGAATASDLFDREPVDIGKIPKVAEWIEKISKKYSKEITETTYERTIEELREGIENGEGIYELGNRIEDLYETMAPNRADLIARTESARAMTAGQAYAYEEYGVKELEWYANPDACELCIYLSGQRWTVEDGKAGTVEYSHPNCSCVFIPKEI